MDVTDYRRKVCVLYDYTDGNTDRHANVVIMYGCKLL